MSFSQHLLIQWVAFLCLGARVVEAQTDTLHVEITIPLFPFLLMGLLLLLCCYCRPRDNGRRRHQGSYPPTYATTALLETATVTDWSPDSTANVKEDKDRNEDHSERASTGISACSATAAIVDIGKDLTSKSLEPTDVETGLVPMHSVDTNEVQV